MAEQPNLHQKTFVDSPLVSVILTAYNEREILKRNVPIIRDVLEGSKYRYELIHVDDGSTDGTGDIIAELIAGRKNERAVYHEQNQGRGKSVADGLRAAAGSIAGFIDIDLEIEAFYLLPLISEIEKGSDLAIARRIYKLRIPFLLRQVLSIGYIRLVRFLLNVPLQDTETGCKFFNREKIIPLLDEIEDRHWFWDTEVMVRSYRKGYRIKEVPALYIRKPETGTTVRLMRDTVDYFVKLLAFYRSFGRRESKKELSRYEGHS
jgi:glycosyltransferase involved in cell wall biosynthesis